MRSLAYAGAHLAIICFSLVDLDSFHAVTEFWVPEVRAGCPDKPFILVGLQSDLRGDESTNAKLLSSGKEIPTIDQVGTTFFKKYEKKCGLYNRNLVKIINGNIR